MDDDLSAPHHVPANARKVVIVSHPQVSVMRADIDDIEAIADALTEAYLDYPWSTWLVPDPDVRPEVLRGIHRLYAGILGVAAGTTWVVQVDDVIVSVASWEPPRHPELPEAAIREFPIIQDLLGAAGERLELAEAAAAPTKPDGPCWILASVGTRPAFRRRGYARDAITAGLYDVDRSGLPAWLETDTEANFALYRSLGFTTTGKITRPANGPTAWAMQRPARTQPTPTTCS